MATNVLMPALGFDMTSGAVARWLKKEGDSVKQGEAIAEVDTEKATVEIQVFTSGILHKILVQPGQQVPVGTVIGLIGAPGETVTSPTPAAATSSSTTASPTPTPKAAEAKTKTNGDGWIKASPVARRIAEAEGVNLAEITGTGPGGRIVEKDVKDYLARAKVAIPTSPLRPSPIGRGVGGEVVELSRMRQTIARRMSESKQTAPHFYVTFDIEMTDAMRMREQLNNLAAENEKVSVNDLIVAAAARTLAKWPVFNASYRGDKLEMHPSINIGIAVALDTGLITPVLHDADKKSLKEIARESRALVERTRANKMHPEDLTGGTFTVTNLGMYGVEEFSGIINPPEAAILAIGAVAKRPIVVDDGIRVAQMMKATLSVDHRVADGAQAARFMQDLKMLLENPVNLLLTD